MGKVLVKFWFYNTKLTTALARLASMSCNPHILSLPFVAGDWRESVAW